MTVGGGRPGGRPPRRYLASWRLWPFVALALISALFAATAMVQADDTWTALACGRHIAVHGVNDADPFSFNSRPAAAAQLGPGASWWQRLVARWHPSGWINQNWLTHVLLFESQRLLGYDSLVVLRFVIYLAAAICLWATMRVRKVSAAAAATAIALAMATARSLLEMRPQDLSNLLVTVEILLLTVSVRRRALLYWALLPILVVWSNLHGGFIFGFILLAVFIGAALVGRAWWGNDSGIDGTWPRVATTVLAAALVGAVVLNPYHVANFTHPLLISVGSDARLWRFVNEWRPTFESGVAAGEPLRFLLFLVVFGIAGAASLAAWRRRHLGSRGGDRKSAPAPSGARALDLAGAAAAAVAVVMALQSSRFVPIAVFTAAPVLGQCLDGLIRFLVGSTHTTSSMAAHQESRSAARLDTALAAGATFLVLTLGGYWGWRFTSAYLAPWPHSLERASLFWRVTWANRRGFDVCNFIRENRLEGRMYNNWVEGGTLEWCQRPDATTARTPLQVYIDGRAQGAFPVSAVERYLAIEGGGPAGLAAIREGRGLSPAETLSVGAWVDAQLRTEGIWVVLLPEGDSPKPIMRGLLARENWQVAYLAPYHVLFVDVDTNRGRELYAGVFDGATRFPDEASRLLTQAYNLFRRDDAGSAREALSDAIGAFSSRPTALAVQTARRAAAFPELKPHLDEFARGIVADYQSHLERYRSEAGFLERNGAAVVAATYLRDAAREAAWNGTTAGLESMLVVMEDDRARAWHRAYW